MGKMRFFTIAAILPLLGACAGGAKPAPATTVSAPPVSPVIQNRPKTPPPTRPAPPSEGFIPPRIMNVPGLEGVIGQGVNGLQRQFGAPQLDVREGDARKLQFRGEACVLDIYLYPLRPGAEPTATYVDARRSSDGLDVDRASCVAALGR